MRNNKELEYLQKAFPITSVSRADILGAYEQPLIRQNIEKRVLKMTDAEMTELAAQMEKIYVPTLFWNSLKTIFQDRYLNPSQRKR